MCTIVPFLCLMGDAYPVHSFVRFFILVQKGKYDNVTPHKIDYG